MNRRSSRFPAILGLAAALCLAGAAACSKKSAETDRKEQAAVPPSESQAVKSAVILRVGESEYSNADFEAYLKRIMGGSAEGLTDEVRSRLFDRFVDDKLLVEAARRQNVYLTDEEKSRYQGKVRDEIDADKGQTMAPADLEALSEQLLIEKYTFNLLQDMEVTDEEVRGYYDSHKSDFLQPERVKASQILLKTEEQAIDVLSRVKSLPEDGFRTLAREESIGPEKEKSGEMGVFSPGQLPYEIEKVIFSLKEGEISQIVQSSYGFHIFRLDKRIGPQLVTLEQAAEGIRTKLLDEKIARATAAHIEELHRTLDWKATPEKLSFPYQRNAS